MAKPRSIYDQLTGVKIEDATITQLDFTKNTFIDEKSIGWWKGPITISKVLEASRTYAHGLPIPESGDIVVVPVPAGDSVNLQPTGSELWAITAINAVASGGNATGALALTDGTSSVPFNTGITVTTSGTIVNRTDFIPPMVISNSLYLNFSETGTTNPIQFFVAYMKIGL